MTVQSSQYLALYVTCLVAVIGIDSGGVSVHATSEQTSQGDKVVLYSPRLWHGSGRWLQDYAIGDTCKYSDCVWTTDKTQSESAHAYMAYVGSHSITDLPSRHTLPSGDESIIVGFEGEPRHKHYMFWENATKANDLDYLVSWEASTADVACIMCDYPQLDALKRSPLPAADTNQKVLVSAFMSNPRNERFQLLKELQRHIDVDVYGRVPGAIPGPTGKEAKLGIIRQYRFHLAWENENSTDYVSEKVTDAFRAGTLPIYMGAPNINEYLPGDKSVINVADFATMKDVADYVKKVHNEESLYEEYFAWKAKPFNPSFLDKRNLCWDDCIVCRTCDLVASHFNLGKKQRTYAMIKPDAVASGYTNDIIDRLKKEKFTILTHKKLQFSTELAREFYIEHAHRPFYNDLVAFMTSGPVVGLVLERVDAIKAWRKLIGPTNSHKARKQSPKSLRALYGVDGERNAVHGSDSIEGAAREVKLIFQMDVNTISAAEEKLKAERRWKEKANEPREIPEPRPVHPDPPLAKRFFSDKDILYLIPHCCGRISTLNDTLSALQGGHAVVIIDGDDGATRDLIDSREWRAEITPITWEPDDDDARLKGPARISRIYFHALTHVVNHMRSIKWIVLLEDDMILSPDAHSYFLAAADAVYQDETLFCASAWNGNSYPHVVGTDTEVKLRRIRYFPGLASMISSRMIKDEILPQWPKYVWDVYMHVRMAELSLQCIQPVRSRATHVGRATGFTEQGMQDRFDNLVAATSADSLERSEWRVEAAKMMEPYYGHRDLATLSFPSQGLADWRDLWDRWSNGTFTACVKGRDWSSLNDIAALLPHPRGIERTYSATLYGQTVHIVLASQHPHACKLHPKLDPPNPNWIHDADVRFGRALQWHRFTPGDYGDNCNDVCQADYKGSVCDAGSAAFVQSCPMLKSKFGCTECSARTESLLAPTGLDRRGSQCRHGLLRHFSCEASHDDIAPLCPCVTGYRKEDGDI